MLVCVPCVSQVFHIQVLHLFLMFLFHVVLFMLVPAAIYMYLEDEWNYLDAFYYCFISLSTIGLGDYIPGRCTSDPPENYHLNAKKLLPKIVLFSNENDNFWHFFFEKKCQMFGNFFYIQMVIFQRVK